MTCPVVVRITTPSTTCPSVVRVTTSQGPPGIGLPAGIADAGKFVRKLGASPYLYELVTPDQVGLPQGLAPSSSPTFVGLTLSGIAQSSLLYTGPGGAIGPLSLGSGLSIVGGALTVTGGGGGGTVTSVGLSMPTGFAVANSPVTGAGALAVTFAAGYGLPTLASQASWDAAAGLAATAIQPGNPGLTTDLSYDPATRLLASSTGADVTLPLFSSTLAGLVGASGGGTTNFLRADGTWATPPAGGAGTDLSYDPATRLLASSTGADVVLTLADSVNPGLLSATGFSKLDSITVDVATLVRKYVRNESGVPIPKGAPVYQTGSSGTTITVALADASTEATAAQTLGLAQEAIAHNSNGYVVAVGLLDGISTATLTEGQIVWLSETAGQLTTARPTQPAHGVVCGYCVKQAAGTAGILYVKVDNGLELNELHDVLLTGAVTGSVLRLAADGLWKPATLAAGDVGAISSVTAQSANMVLAGPTAGAAAAPTFRALVADDIPGLSGTNTGDISLSDSVADVLSLSGQILLADDPGSDRLLFWDESAGKLRHLTLGTNLSINDTTLDATGGGAAGEVRCDASPVTTIYVGRAAANTAESSPGWAITRTTYSALGVLQATAAASGAWTNRANLTYA